MLFEAVLEALDVNELGERVGVLFGLCKGALLGLLEGNLLELIVGWDNCICFGLYDGHLVGSTDGNEVCSTLVMAYATCFLSSGYPLQYP